MKFGDNEEVTTWSAAATRIRIAAALAVAIACLGALGYAHIRTEAVGASFNLDGEQNVPAVFSALLLLAAAVVCALAGTRPGVRGLPWLVVAGFLTLFAFDELLTLHERLENAARVDWQLLYAPLAVAVIAATSRLLWLHRARPLVCLLLMAGGAAWVVAQLCEAIQWSGDVFVGPQWLIVIEETLEMAGTTALGLAALTAIAAARAAKRAPEAAPPRIVVAVGPPRGVRAGSEPAELVGAGGRR